MSYPEHEKLEKVQSESQVCGEFLEWLESNKKYELAQYVEGRNFLHKVHYSLQDLLAEFFGIDLKKLESEKREMLKAIRPEKKKVSKHSI